MVTKKVLKEAMSIASEQFAFSEEFQNLVLACCIRHPEKFNTYGGVLKSKYFTGVQATIAAQAILGYHVKTGFFPTWATVTQLVMDHAAKLGDDVGGDAQEYVKGLRKLATTDVDYVVGKVVAFARERATINAVKLTLQSMKEGKEMDVVKLFSDALTVGQNVNDLGLILEPDDIRSTVKKVTSSDYGVRTGFPLIDNIWKNGWAPGWLIVPLAPPKRLKCLGKGTPVMMFDGSTRPVEDLQVGDLIMGDDLRPRKIETCGQGQGPMYKVEQANGDDFICNDAHILCVQSVHGDVKEITASEYSNKAAWFKREWKGYKVGVDFPHKDTHIDPYFLGIWLGDGTSLESSVTVGHGDTEIGEFLSSYVAQLGMAITFEQGQGCVEYRMVSYQKDPDKGCQVEGCQKPHRSGGYCREHYAHFYYHNGFTVFDGNKPPVNPLKAMLKQLGVLNNKHIPDLLKFNDRATRLQLLAGLIDSDGTVSGTVHGSRMEFSNVNERLARDTFWLARSLGFMATISKYKTAIKSIGYVGHAWNVRITGKLSEIPVKLPRKKGVDNSRRKNKCYSITVRPIGQGDYYGFTIDGNGRFLLGDFTVTHNTTFCLNLALNIIGATVGEDVIYYTCEISQELAFVRALMNIASLPQETMYQSTESFIERAIKELQRTITHRMVFKGFGSRTATINDLKAHAKMLISMGLRPKAIFIDYADTIKQVSVSKDHKSYQMSADVYTDAKAMGTELGCAVIMPDRCTAETVGKPVPNMKSFQGAFEKAGIVDIAMGLCATDVEFKNDIMRWFVFLNRHGPAFQHLRGRFDASLMKMWPEEEIPYDPEDEAAAETPSRGNGSGKPYQRKKSRDFEADLPRDLQE